MLKRSIDIFLSIFLIFALILPLIIISILIAITIGRPVFYCARRPGKDEKIFTMYKFRTMTNARDPSGKLLSDTKRMTRLGKILRKTSLDELPELWNVLRGDMSLVGPRPLAKEYLPLYSPEQARRHTVRPGITGWAQVNGRNSLSWREKFELDIWYVNNQSFLLDVKILFITLKKVLLQADVKANGQAEVESFNGKN